MPVAIESPRPRDAGDWVRFLAAEQARTYAGLVPDGFEAHALREADLERLAARFAEPGDSRHAIAREGGLVVGIASATPAPADWEVRMGHVPAPADRELARLYVAESMQGTGLGGRLFDAVVDARPHYLWLIDGNARAARFYERRGFRHLDESVPAGGGWGGIPMHRMLRD